MRKILIIQNSLILAKSISISLERELDVECIIATSIKEATPRIHDSIEPFFAGIFGLILEDSSGLDIIDFAVNNRVPPIVFTSTMKPEMRKEVWSRGIVDYVIKESPESLQYLINLVKRLILNTTTEVMVASSKMETSIFTSTLLSLHKYQVHSAENQEEALSLLEKYSDIKLVLMGEDPKDINPVKFIDALRQKHSRDHLGIITMASEHNNETSINSLKHGANDFLAWPFSAEEFHSRVTNTITTLEMVDKLRIITQTDFLTGICNRGYFMKRLDEEHKRCTRHEHPLSLVMLDADKFKNINDTYGHSVGDIVLKKISEVVRNLIRTEDVFGRIGGEEFVLALPETNHDQALATAERIRKAISEVVIKAEGHSISFTMSFGVSTMTGNEETSASLLLKQSDTALYEAKETGRNKVVGFKG